MSRVETGLCINKVIDFQIFSTTTTTTLKIIRKKKILGVQRKIIFLFRAFPPSHLFYPPCWLTGTHARSCKRAFFCFVFLFLVGIVSWCWSLLTCITFLAALSLPLSLSNTEKYVLFSSLLFWANNEFQRNSSSSLSCVGIIQLLAATKLPHLELSSFLIPEKEEQNSFQIMVCCLILSTVMTCNWDR